jgi:hypothetical protein
MSNELRHIDVGDEVQKSEWLGVGTHIADGQTEGDTFYFDGTYWIRRPINTQNYTIQTGSSYSVQSKDNYIIANNGTSISILLPAATGSGRAINIKNIGVGNATIDGNGSDTIDDELTQILYQWEGFQIVDYVSNKWMVL